MSAIDETAEGPLRPDTDVGDANIGEFTRLKRMVQDGQRARGKWRTEAERAFDFVANHQWSDEDKAVLDQQNRPAVTFNRTAPIVKAVCGLEVNNRQGVVYLPRTQDDTGMNEMVTNVAKWVRDECQAEDEESEAFRDAVICGEGWTETRMDYDDDPMGKIVQERIDPLEMGVNRGAGRANYSDARLIYRVRDIDVDDARAIAGVGDDIIAAALDAKWLDDGPTPADGGMGNKKDYPDSTRDGVSSGRNGERLTVKLVQCQYWKREQFHVVAMPGDDNVQHMTPEEFTKFEERTAALDLVNGVRTEYSAAKTTKKVYYQCFLGASGMFGHEKMEMGRCQFKAITGDRDRKLRCFYGIVRDMFDPQMWANKWLSQTMHIMNTNAKGGLLAETDAFLDKRKAQRDWADNSKIVWVKPGSLTKQKIKERTPAPMPQGLDNLMMFAISSIRDVTGINLELLGQADREQAASLEQQRRQSAMTILASLFDSLRRYRKDQGRLLLHFIWLLPEGTLVRVVDKGQVQYIPFVKQGIEIEKFDIIIDEAPNSPDQKQFVWSVTAQILQMGILPPPAIIELLKYSPYPESVVQEIRSALGMDGEMPPDQLKQKLEQAEAALKVMEEKLQQAIEQAQTAEDKNALELMKLEIDEYRAQTERDKATWDARIKATAAIVKREEGAVAEEGAEPTSGGAPTTGAPGSYLPDVHSGGVAGGNDLVAINQKIDALADMFQQFMQASMSQPPESVPVEAAPPMNEPPEGEM